MPSSIAAFVAQTASSTLSFFSFNSTSLFAPIYKVAIPPCSLEARSSCPLAIKYSMCSF